MFSSSNLYFYDARVWGAFVLGSCSVGLLLLMYVKLQQFKKGIIISFGISKLPKELKIYYVLSYVFMGISVAFVISFLILNEVLLSKG